MSTNPIQPVNSSRSFSFPPALRLAITNQSNEEITLALKSKTVRDQYLNWSQSHLPLFKKQPVLSKILSHINHHNPPAPLSLTSRCKNALSKFFAKKVLASTKLEKIQLCLENLINNPADVNKKMEWCRLFSNDEESLGITQHLFDTYTRTGLLPPQQFADICKLKDAQGKTFFHYALSSAWFERALAIMNRVPLSQIGELCKIKDKNGTSLFQVAIDNNHVDHILPPLSNLSSNHIIEICKIHPTDSQKQKDKMTDVQDQILRRLASKPFDSCLDTFKELAAAGFFVSHHVLRIAMCAQNFGILDYIFNQLDSVMKLVFTNEIFASLLRFGNEHTAQIIFKHFPNFAAKSPPGLFYQAVKDGNVHYVKWILENGYLTNQEKQFGLSNQIMDSILHHAQSNLPMIRLLCQYATDKERYSYPSILKPPLTDPLSSEKLLLNMALNSPLTDVYEIAKLHPPLLAVFPDVKKKIALLVRLPPKFREEVVSKSLNYANESKNYAMENSEFIDNILPRVSRMSKNELLSAIIANRVQRNPNLDEKYQKRTLDVPYTVSTPFTFLPYGPILYPRSVRDCTIFDVNRYYPSLNHLTNLFYNPENGEWQIKDNGSISVNIVKDIGIKAWILKGCKEVKGHCPIDILFDHATTEVVFQYTLPDGEKVSITQWHAGNLNFLWTHPDRETVAKMQSHMEDLHTQLLEYHLDVDDIDNKKKFDELLARAYWLTATLCETSRGTPHNAMMYLNIILAYHKLPPLIPKLEHYFLDNTMLVTPIEEVIKKWNTYFEPV